jgi:hypothetical protein
LFAKGEFMGFKPPRFALGKWAKSAGVLGLLALGFFIQMAPVKIATENAVTDQIPETVRNPAYSNESRQALAREKEKFCSNLHSFICRKQKIHRDPSGFVRPDIDGEVLALRSYQDIIQQHPDWTSDQVDQEFVDLIYTPKIKGRLEASFNWVRHTLIRFIEKQPDQIFTATEKRQLKKRLNNTRLDLPSRSSPYPDEPDLLTKSDVFYEGLTGSKMRLRIGGAYPLSVRSWFNFVFTMAHELAHAIDPCEIRSAGQSYPAYERLSACFLRSGWLAAPNNRSECGHNDQLSEIFADWVAVQISEQALRSYSTEFQGLQILAAASNAVRDLCEEDDEVSEEDILLHPPAKVRINKIFGKNPKIREVLGCAPVQDGPEYCTF